MSILKNAINSIEVGIEDYQSDSEKRNISAVRNIFAGILLLFKEKLMRLSPDNDKELLIKKKIVPVIDKTGLLQFKGEGKNTVDVEAIKERFINLNVTVDWKRFNEINTLRNDLEHYYTEKSDNNVREILAKSFLIIRDFLDKELCEDPVKIIDRDCWSFLLELEEIYAAEEKACKDSLKNIKWQYKVLEEASEFMRCLICDSSLVKAKKQNSLYIQMHCMSCGEDFHASDTYAQCIEDCLGDAAHIAIKDGGEAPYDTCPECDRDTFILDEMCCVSCNYTITYQNCSRCNQKLSLDEQDLEGLCGYCHNLYDKVMKE